VRRIRLEPSGAKYILYYTEGLKSQAGRFHSKGISSVWDFLFLPAIKKISL
jgi:hypothetical protein